MPIRFTCECGQPLTARDEIAGKRVRCTACEAVVTVPEEDGDGAPGAAPLRIRCEECGKSVQVKADSAGTRVKCPGCASILTVPAARRGGAAVQAERPRPRRARDDEYDDERD